MELVILRVHTVDGESYDIPQRMEHGIEAQLRARLPKEIGNGVWPNETTFIPAGAIARVEIVRGPSAQFPKADM